MDVHFLHATWLQPAECSTSGCTAVRHGHACVPPSFIQPTCHKCHTRWERCPTGHHHRMPGGVRWRPEWQEATIWLHGMAWHVATAAPHLVLLAHAVVLHGHAPLHAGHSKPLAVGVRGYTACLVLEAALAHLLRLASVNPACTDPL